jgi:DNA-binding MarR family transcriptional regulator
VQLPPRLEVLHQPVRLRVMALLCRHRDVSFTAVRDALGLTDGNLATHARRLEEAGYLQARRVLSGGRFEVRHRITPAGSQAFADYLAELRRFLDAEGAGQGPAS